MMTPSSDVPETTSTRLRCSFWGSRGGLIAAWIIASVFLLIGLAVWVWTAKTAGISAVIFALICVVLALLFSRVSEKLVVVDSQTLRIGAKSLWRTRWEKPYPIDALREAVVVATRDSDNETDFAVRLHMNNGATISLGEGITRKSAEECLEAFERACGRTFGERLEDTPPPAEPDANAPFEFDPDHMLRQLRQKEQNAIWVALGLGLLIATLVVAWLLYRADWLLAVILFASFFAMPLFSYIPQLRRIQRAVRAGRPEPATVRIYLHEPYGIAPQRRVSIPQNDANKPSRDYHVELRSAHGVWEFSVSSSDWTPTEGTFAAAAYFLELSAGPVLAVTAAGLLIPRFKPKKTQSCRAD